MNTNLNKDEKIFARFYTHWPWNNFLNWFHFYFFPQQLRSFKLEITVASSYHPKIIGRKGQVIQKIRSEHGVQIQFPPVESSEVDADKIILTGYEHNCEAAKAAIFKIVHELVGVRFI